MRRKGGKKGRGFSHWIEKVFSSIPFRRKEKEGEERGEVVF